MKANINALNAGELSPHVLGRVDLPNISKGARLMRNMLPRVVGGAFRRPGMPWVCAAHSPDTYQSRLIPFNYSSDQHFVLELGNYVMRFIQDDAVVQDPDGGDLVVVTPWSSEQVFALQFTQVNDVVFFAHADVAPQRLIRYADDNWTLTTLMDQIDISQVVKAATVGFRGAWTRNMDFTWVDYMGVTVRFTTTNPKGHGLAIGNAIIISGSSDHNSVPNGNYLVNAVTFSSIDVTLAIAAPNSTTGTAQITVKYVKVTTEVPHQIVDGDTVNVTASSDVLALPIAAYSGGAVDQLDAYNVYLTPAGAPAGGATGDCAISYKAAYVRVWSGINGTSLTTALAASKSVIPTYEIDNDMTFALGVVPTKFLRRITGTFICSSNTAHTFKLTAKGTPGSAMALSLPAFPTFIVRVGGNPWIASPQTGVTPVLVSGTRYKFQVDWFHAGGSTSSAELKLEVNSGAGYVAISAANLNLEMPDTDALIAPFDENQWPAMQDENVTATTMACSATAAGTVGAKLTATTDVFTADNEGTCYQLAHHRKSSSESVTFIANTTYTTGPSGAGVRGIGKWAIFSYGAWSGEIFLEQKDASGAWETLRSYKSLNGDRNIIEIGTLEVETFIRIKAVITDWKTGTGRVELTWVDTIISGLVRATTFVDSKTMTCDVIKEIYLTDATTRWSEGAWNARRGYPRAVAIHQQRLIFGGTITQPQTFWGSVAGDLINFRRGLYDADSYVEQLAATESSPIVWIASQEGVIIATEKEEWLVDGGSQGAAISPTSVRALRKSGNGAAAISPLLAGSVVLFVRAGGRSLLEYLYAFDSQSYIAPDLSQLAEHLTDDGIKQIAFQREPEARIWVVNNVGELLSLTYKRDQEVIAWAKHVTNGTVESVCVTNGAGGIDDVFVSVLRYINALPKRSIEKLDPGTPIAVENEDRLAMNFFDCSRRLTGASSLTWAGLGHLASQEVSVYADGSERPNATISAGGVLTLTEEATDILVGLPYTSTVQPMPIEVALPDGTMQGRKVKVSDLAIRFHRTGAATFRNSVTATSYPVKLRRTDAPTGAPIQLVSGMIKIPGSPSYDDTIDIVLETSGGEPMNILSIIPTFAHYGD